MNFSVPIFERNKMGRDLVVGDIHGMWNLLEHYLSAISFDYKNDRLFAVGDLVDRGPDPKEFLNWINKPYFFSVMGNHDANIIHMSPGFSTLFMTYSFDHPSLDWYKNSEIAEQIKIAEGLRTLPFAIELRDGEKKVGIVHGCSRNDWAENVRYIKNPDALRTKDLILWGRESANEALSIKHILHEEWDEELIEESIDLYTVKNVDWLFHGHTVDHDTCEPFNIANRYFIDGGACYIDENDKAGFIIVDAWNPSEPVITPKIYSRIIKNI